MTIHTPSAPGRSSVVAHAPAAASPNGNDNGNGDSNTFASFGLAPELLAAVAQLGYTRPTAVQAQALALAWPQANGQRDNLMVSSQTGSGKTAAFLLPLLHSLLQMSAAQAAEEKAAHDARLAAALAQGEPAPRKPRRRNPKNAHHFKPCAPLALVLAPTRELAQQVARDAIDLLRKSQGLHVATVVGGMPYGRQLRQLQNADLVVATPGRLLDLQRSGKLKLDQVRFLVVDEADRMLGLGFVDALKRIHELTAQREQTLMFSATFARPIQKLAEHVMPSHGNQALHRLQIDTPQQSQEHIRQELYWADNRAHKRQLLDYWLRDPSIKQAIVFASTQIACDALARELHDAGFVAASLHGGLSQFIRNRRLQALRSGKLQILVATDVAARGIDVPTITHVFNYGLPMHAEDYTHRIGRTGRAGRKGLAVTLAEGSDRKRLTEIQTHTGKAFAALLIDGLEPSKFFAPLSNSTRPRQGPARGKPGAHKRSKPQQERRHNSPRNQRDEPQGEAAKAPARWHDKKAARRSNAAPHGQHPRRTRRPRQHTR